MNEKFKQLEAIESLESEIIAKTKINKVLKMIIRLDSIPKDEVYKFKQRSKVLLEKYQEILAAAEKGE